MADSVDTLVAEVQTVVDVTPTEALVLLNRRHRRMVTEAKCLRKVVSVGSTVADQAFYTVTGVVELYSLEVDGVPYGKARRPDIYGYSQDALVWEGPTGAGLIVADADTTGVEGITLIPAPSDAGLAITAFAACKPADLAAGGAASTLKVDDDLYDALVEGAIATQLARIGEGDPDRLEARFDAAVEKQRRRTRKRFRGPGPTQIRIAGVNA